jgi:hypothetical protein
MKTKFWGAFAVTLLVLIAACGFIAVDLSTDKYMPGQFGSLFEIQSLTAESLDFELLGKAYSIDFYALKNPPEAALAYRTVLTVLLSSLI